MKASILIFILSFVGAPSKVGFQKAYLGMPLSEYKQYFPNNKKFVIPYFLHNDIDLKNMDCYSAVSKTSNGTNFSIKAYFYKNKLIIFDITYNDFVNSKEIARQIENKYGAYQYSTNNLDHYYTWNNSRYQIVLSEVYSKASPGNFRDLSIHFFDKQLYAKMRADIKKQPQGLIE